MLHNVLEIRNMLNHFKNGINMKQFLTIFYNVYSVTIEKSFEFFITVLWKKIQVGV